MSRTKRTFRPSSGRLSELAWTDEHKSELLAWAEHCRKRDGSGKHFEETVARHLHSVFGLKFSYGEIDSEIRKLAQGSTTPLASIHYSYIYTSYGKGSLIPCVIQDRSARKVFQRRVDELDNNPNSKPSRVRVDLARDRKSPSATFLEPARINASGWVKDGRKQRMNSRKSRNRRKHRSKASST